MPYMPVSSDALQSLFTEARTYAAWLPRTVEDSLLLEIYDLMKMGPTAANTCPARIVFVKSTEAKAKLLPAMDHGNVEKTRAAPVTAILAYDLEFYEKLPQLFPHADARSWYLGHDDLIRDTAFRNSSLQGAYLMLAARAKGLDCGPMSGFDAVKVDALFFAGTRWKANFVINLGYGDAAKLHPRLPRLPFAEAAQIL